MNPTDSAISSHPASLPRTALRTMVRLVRLLYRLGLDPAYQALVGPELPAAARFDPGCDSVMMGYDFHLGPEGPRLIEVNTNAGGGWLAWRAQAGGGEPDLVTLSPQLQRKLRLSFAAEWAGRKGMPGPLPERVAILDESPAAQFLYPEMQVFAKLFRSWGVTAEVVDPGELAAGPEGVRLDGGRVDLIYNRHCDFYLESAPLAGVRAAYLAGRVCLTPNPRAYGLLADKRRMILWSDPQVLAQLPLSDRERAQLLAGVPASFLLAGADRERVWQQRNDWVFKPVDRFGSRGVLLGRKISRSRFDELPAETTLVQRLIPPSLTPVSGTEALKTDFRLFAYRNRILGVAARLYQGQVTNLRTPGGGFAPVRIS